MALKRVSELSATQRSIRYYANISNFAFWIAIALPVIAFSIAQTMTSIERAAVTLAVAAMSTWGFVVVDAWCKQQMRCPICKQSVFMRWFFELQVGFWSWVSGIPQHCPHCNARWP